MLGTLINGIIIGIFVAAPVGPVNIICIQRTLRHGRLNGYLASLGAVLGDTLFALAAWLQFGAIRNFLTIYGAEIQTIGGLFLLLVGCIGFIRVQSKIPDTESWNDDTGLYRSIFMTFIMTITNPMALLGMLALFAGAGGFMKQGGSSQTGYEIIIGVGLGASLWWLFLIAMIGYFHGRMKDNFLRRISQFSSLAILAFAVFVLISAWY